MVLRFVIPQLRLLIPSLVNLEERLGNMLNPCTKWLELDVETVLNTHLGSNHQGMPSNAVQNTL